MSEESRSITAPKGAQTYSSFSPGRIWTIATHTLTQLVRMKILIFLAVFGVVIMVVGFVFPMLNREQQFATLNNVAFGLMTIFSIVIAVSATALLIPRDIEDRTLYTILCKPVPRYEYLVGKLLGVILLLAVGFLALDIVLCAVLWLKQAMMASSITETLQKSHQDSEANLAQMRTVLSHFGPSWSLQAALWCVFLQSAVMTSMALLMSCVATSSLFTIIISLCFAIVGQGQGLLRSFALKSLTVSVKKVAAFVLATLCPDLTLFDLVSPAVRGDIIPFGVVAQVTGFAVLYIVLYTAVAYLFFAEKEI